MKSIKVFNTEYISLDSVETPQQLAELVDELRQGNDIVLVRNGRLLGKIIPSTNEVPVSAARNRGYERIPWHPRDLDRPLDENLTDGLLKKVSGFQMTAAGGVE